MTELTDRQAAALLFATELGMGLRRVRLLRRLTVEELAEKSGLTPSLVRRIERGEFLGSIKRLADIAFGLDVALDIKFVERSPHPAHVPSFDEETQP